MILHTDNFFENVYGLEKDKPSSQIGYDKNGEPVYLPENYGVNINRPSPELQVWKMNYREVMKLENSELPLSSGSVLISINYNT